MACECVVNVAFQLSVVRLSVDKRGQRKGLCHCAALTNLGAVERTSAHEQEIPNPAFIP